MIFTTATSAFVGMDKTEYNAVATNVQAISKAIAQIGFAVLGFAVAGAVLAIGAWIGWTMATTPAPKPIEEIGKTENE